jgi:hypothetical protein
MSIYSVIGLRSPRWRGARTKPEGENMGLRFLFCGVALAALGLGCTTVAEGVRNMIVEPAEYCWHLDNCIDHKRNRAVAWQALAEFLRACPEGVSYSVDFGRGFRDGFADYLFAGGAGNPPPVPPRYYWRPEYQNPEGQSAMRDWFIGFRRGAAAAKQSGLRQLVTVPASVSLPARSTLGPGILLPRVGPGGSVPGVGAAPDKPETLPAPKPLPPGADKKDDAGPKEAPPSAQGVSFERLVPIPIGFAPTAEPPLPNENVEARPEEIPGRREAVPRPVDSKPGENQIVAWLRFSAPVDGAVALLIPGTDEVAACPLFLTLRGSRSDSPAEAGEAWENSPETDETGERPAVFPRPGFGRGALWVARP